ncbi:hypothetical protein [Haloarchaeobius sp. TZWSO28]|uniref:hypothetical protein n=1 Tax=Haloarchaeobius sp. TZWSO28 TaxID=3446119 RepID=UPI003EB7395A
MADLSKRQYLKYAGASLAALSLGVGGKLAADGSFAPAVGETSRVAAGANPEATPILRSAGIGDILDYERKDDGAIEFDWGLLSFETESDGSFEIEDLGVDIEAIIDDGDDLESLDMRVEDTELYFDLEILEDRGIDAVELDFAFRDEWVQFEFDADGPKVEFESDGSGYQFEAEDDSRDIEYMGRNIKFEFKETDGDNWELEITGAIRADIEWNEDGELDVDYIDGRIAVDIDVGSLDVEYAGEDVMFEWEYVDYGTDDEFEARRI